MSLSSDCPGQPRVVRAGGARVSPQSSRLRREELARPRVRDDDERAAANGTPRPEVTVNVRSRSSEGITRRSPRCSSTRRRSTAEIPVAQAVTRKHRDARPEDP